MTFRLDLDGTIHTIDIAARKPEILVEIDGRAPVEAGCSGNRNDLYVEVGPEDTFKVATAQDGDLTWVRMNGRTFRVRIEDPVAAAQDSAGGNDDIRAPMPGTVIEVLKAAGDRVSRGDKVMTIESMKLQTSLAAPRDGVLAEVLHAVGDTFNKDATIARLEPLAEDD
ncbi:MAG: hypothetical protein P1U65_17850 [Minwuia sp.]|nr:hypothetical protein [Minwuia sp.]